MPLPGEPGYAGTHISLPGFLQPLEPADTVPGAVPETTGAGLKQPWIGDSWVWIDEGTSRLEPTRHPTEAERDFAELNWWRRGFVRVAVLLLVCAAIACLAFLVARTQRR